MFIKGSKQVKNLNIHKRWTKSYFDILSLPDFLEEDEEKQEEAQDEPTNQNNDESKEDINSPIPASSINQDQIKTVKTVKLNYDWLTF